MDRGRGERRGTMLVSAVVLVMAAATISVVLTTMASISNTDAETDKQRLRAQYLAEGALAMVEQDLLERVAGGEYARTSTFYLEFDEDGFEELFEEEGTAPLGGFQVPYRVEVVSDPEETTGLDGLRALAFTLRLSTEAEVAGARSTANRLILARLMPVYQFAVFYDMDLEIWPGPDMVLSGRVHANGDLYVGAGNRLRFDSNYVRATGQYVQDRAHTNQNVSGGQRVEFRRWVEDPESAFEPEEYVLLPRRDDLAALGVPSTSGLDSRFLGHDVDGDGYYDGPGEYAPYEAAVLELFSEPDFYAGGTGSTLKSGEHEVESISAPDMDVRRAFVENGDGDWAYDAAAGKYVEVAPGSGTHSRGTFNQFAGLSIQVAEDGSWEAWSDGILVTAALAPAVRNDTLADRHQNEVIDTFEIDLEELADTGLYPDNGLLYLNYNGSGVDSDVKGFVLTNGSKLAGPLTAVSENSIYVHGDYNVADKQPASVVADRVALLSNAWDGTKTLGSGKPPAADTTYNMAVMSGNRESVWGNRLAGGFENLVRFHENWSGVDCEITGSFTALWEPTYDRVKNKGVAYSPPRRDFGFDQDFTSLADLPPFTPCMLQLNPVATW